MKSKKPKLKKLPARKSDEAAEHFVVTAELSDYDLSGMVPARSRFTPKIKRVNIRTAERIKPPK